jgi:Arc/MetJ-type ribon-helix-helix transcriptional regulator
MKLSVSLSETDVAILDEYAARTGLTSRSAALQHAVRLLTHTDLDTDYARAWNEWDTSADAPVWEPAAVDGVSHAAR